MEFKLYAGIMIEIFPILFLLWRCDGITSKEITTKYTECFMMEKVNDGIPRYVLPHRRMVQAALHEPAYLHCVVPQFRKHLVAWTRVHDNALLTAGEISFTTDPRFQISLRQPESDWILIIRRVEKSDSGCYLCEVNTEPQSTIYAVYLNVMDTWRENDATVANIGKQTTNLMANMVGNEVLLDCIITIANGSLKDTEIIWSRNGRPIDFSKIGKYLSKVKRDSQIIVHTLRILKPSSDDDGNYACGMKDKPESSHMLHVNSNGAYRITSLPAVLIILIIYCVTYFSAHR